MTRLYRIWSNMKSRCYNPKVPKYKSYGARGITVCTEWHTFKVFEAWAHTSNYSETLQIDRINNDGNYEPDNCRWVTALENARNKQNSIRIGGESLQEISERTGVAVNTIYERIRAYGWTPEEAVTTKLVGVNNEIALAEKAPGVTTARVRSRLKYGWSLEDALNTPVRNGNYKRK